MTKNRKAMKKLEKVISEAYDYGKLPKGLSLYDFREVESGYEALKTGGKFYTVTWRAAKALTDMGFDVDLHGVGYSVEL